MMKKIVSLTALGALLAAALTVSMIAGQAPARGGAATGPCDRACLEGFVDRYLDAMAARDPKQLPLAANVKYTENGRVYRNHERRSGQHHDGASTQGRKSTDHRS